jgi:hypothetical protein
MSEVPDAMEVPDDEETTVTAHCCNPDRTVFTEEDNSDGWIATDLTVELDR